MPGRETQNNKKRYEQLYYQPHKAEHKIEKKKEAILIKEMEECSFKPNILDSQMAVSQSATPIQMFNSGMHQSINNLTQMSVD